AQQLVTSLQEVRFVQGSVRFEHGLGVRLTALFPADAKGAAPSFLKSLAGGPGNSELTGLPTGSVVASQATHGDGAQNVVQAKVLLDGLLSDWPGRNKLLPALDRQTFLGVFSEVWQQLQGSRVAVYRNAAERQQGLFSVVAILDTANAQEF